MDTPIRVLMATVATGERAAHVSRALASLRGQAGVEARPIVVVNGESADPALVREIARHPGVTLLRRVEANLPLALATGRRAVDTPWFAQLDDDDELLPDALARRLARITRPDQPDAVVTNGIVRGRAGDSASMPDTTAVARDPAGVLMDANWMLPGSALFRTATVTEALFEATPRFLEWTYVALVLATRFRIAWLPEATVVHYEGHAFSVDLSRECTLARPRAFDALLRLDLPPGIRARLRAKQGAAWHAAAEASRHASDFRGAWSAHLRSVASPGGSRYLAYTRRLLGLLPGASSATATAKSP